MLLSHLPDRNLQSAYFPFHWPGAGPEPGSLSSRPTTGFRSATIADRVFAHRKRTVWNPNWQRSLHSP